MKEVNAYTITQLWELAEGHCSPEQAQALHALIATDKAVAAVWQEIELTQRTLQTITPEQPSLRFQQRILEQLPARSRDVELVPRWGRWLVALGFVLALVPVLASWGERGVASSSKLFPQMEMVASGFRNWWSQGMWPVLDWSVSQSALLYLALLGVSVSILLAVDRIVQHQKLH
jgi:anti-sigma factor RsiW